MTLNVTLLVQIAHFLIAYFLIRWIFIKPAYSLLTTIEAEERATHNELRVLAQSVQDQEQVVRNEWSACAKKLVNEKPSKSEVTFEHVSLLTPEAFDQKELSSDTARSLSRTIGSALVEKITQKGTRA